MAVNDFQLALMGLGATAVGAVWAYNKWQEREHRKLAERILQGGDKTDVLLGAAGEESPSGGSDLREPALAAGDDATEMADAPAASPWVDDVADAIAHLDFAEAIPAPALWAAQAEWSGHLGKALRWSARSVDPDDQGWHRLTAHDAGRYTRVVGALQLADRRGAVTEGELGIFVDGVAAMAAQLVGVAVTPDIEKELVRARALDDFCASVDFQLAVHVTAASGGAFAGEQLRELAEAGGMRLGDDGRFHSSDDEGNTLYTLANVGVELFDADTLGAISTSGITFSLDVPNVPQGPAVFDRMVAAARQLTQGLGGALVDSQHVPLTDEMIAAIRGRIEEMQTRMAAQQIVAGSARARRLFS